MITHYELDSCVLICLQVQKEELEAQAVKVLEGYLAELDEVLLTVS